MTPAWWFTLSLLLNCTGRGVKCSPPGSTLVDPSFLNGAPVPILAILLSQRASHSLIALDSISELVETLIFNNFISSSFSFNSAFPRRISSPFLSSVNQNSFLFMVAVELSLIFTTFNYIKLLIDNYQGTRAISSYLAHIL